MYINLDNVKKEHSHYYKKVPGEYIDVYRVLQLFEVTDPCIQHAIKKLLVAGGRGAKDINKDVKEAIDSLSRWIDMREEETKQSRYSSQYVPVDENSPVRNLGNITGTVGNDAKSYFSPPLTTVNLNGIGDT